MKQTTRFIGLTIAGLMVSCLAQARDQIKIVGSSTVFPFSATVAERFGHLGDHPTPVVESTGSGGGIKLFCGGLGDRTPDITNSSRRMKKSELEKCAANGVKDVVEITVGYDGIVIANAKKAPEFKLTLKQVFQAVAKQIPDENGKLVNNPYVRWSDIDPSLPDSEIEVLGPPPTSGTRDAFLELAMETGAKKFETLAELRKKDKKAFKKIAHAVREDGAYVDSGENDNLIVSKLEVNPKALGIFGFSFLDQNRERVKGARIDGVPPTFENIAEGAYPISRSLQFYLKAGHIGIIKGLEEYALSFLSDEAASDEGYLVEKGLIPLSDELRREMRSRIEDTVLLTANDL